MCEWLKDGRWPDHWFPAKAHIIITTVDRNIGFVVDPRYPLRWREEPWHGDIRRISAIGLKQNFKVFLVIDHEHIPVRP